MATSLLACAAGLGLAVAAPPDPKAPRPHFLFILQDDLGFDDVGFNNPESVPYSQSITQLAKEGVILTNHYVHWHCSPTRRSFLSGRLPIHHGEMLSGDTTDDLDLRWNLISQKLAPAGYRSYWFGKGHTGYMSMNHLPTHRSFAHWTGFLSGAQSYTAAQRWKDEGPYNDTTYSSDLYGEATLNAVQQHDAATPMMLYLPWQAVHAPYDVPPAQDGARNGTDVQQMLWSADQFVGKVVAALRSKGMWDTTLVVYTADNGGTCDGGRFPTGPSPYGGTNFPLRGNKHTNWQGGMNGAAFVSGGFLPANLRGTTSDVAMHVVDWYATFCTLAGVDPADDSAVPPLPVDPSLPPTKPPPKDIYGNKSWPGIDGVNVWPILLNPALRADRGAAHHSLTLSREVLLVNGTMKLVVAQPDPSILANKESMPPRLMWMMGWRLRNQTWLAPSTYDSSGCGLVFLRDGTPFKPCLFDVSKDPRETTDLSRQQPELLSAMWRELNTSFLTWFHSRTPAAMLGHCDAQCAGEHWRSVDPSSGGNGPICGVPGCS